VQLHQQKGMISLSPPTICNSAGRITEKAGQPQQTEAYDTRLCHDELPRKKISALILSRKGTS